MRTNKRNPSRNAVVAVGTWFLCSCLFAFGAEDWYAFVMKWPEVPETWRFSSPFGIAVDSSGKVYVADTGNHKVRKFDADGTQLG
ncbi:MAG: hypothetical protein R3239_08140, partial [Thermodesulfobacteriota bacterium]|nr:hypothetical protein [Thermodesulfobacteriota bacterium]